MRMLFTTEPLFGHFFPLVPLAWAARALGHEVLVAVPENFVDAVVRSGLPVVSSGSRADFVEMARYRPGQFDEQRRFAHGRVFGHISSRVLPGVLLTVREWRPDVVVSERAEFAGPVAAQVHGTPLVDLRWGVAELPEYRAAATEVLAGELRSLGLTGIPEAGLLLDPWPRSMRLPHAADHGSVRHVSYNGGAHLPGWVLRPRVWPRVCLTLGTVVPHFDVDLLRENVLGVVRGLTELNLEVVIAVDERIAESWGALPEGVRQAGRLPLFQVLGASGLLIHHGGQGTTLTALEVGLPQLVLPQFDDQFDNADAVVRAGAGVRLLPSEADVRTIVERGADLLGAPGFTAAAGAAAREIAALPSPFEAVGMLEDLVAEKHAAA